jgi:Ca2+-binding RTX toxin-like protein
MIIERLESRRLLSVTLRESGGLEIVGTNGADVVSVTLEGKYVVVRGDASYRGRFRAADVKGIQILARGGKDVIKTELKAAIWGGAGDDTLIGSRRDDYIQGDRGDDVLRGRGGGDWLVGARGRDVLMGGAGNDTLSEVEPRDVLRGGPGDDTVRRLIKDPTIVEAPEITFDLRGVLPITPVVHTPPFSKVTSEVLVMPVGGSGTTQGGGLIVGEATLTLVSGSRSPVEFAADSILLGSYVGTAEGADWADPVLA